MERRVAPCHRWFCNDFEHLRSCYAFGGLSMHRAGSRPGSLGHYCPRAGREAWWGEGLTLPAQVWPWVSTVTCSLCPPSPDPSSSRRAALGGGRAAQEQCLPWHCPPTLPPMLCFAPRLQCHLTGTFTPFMFSALVLFLFHFPFVFSAALS